VVVVGVAVVVVGGLGLVGGRRGGHGWIGGGGGYAFRGRWFRDDEELGRKSVGFFLHLSWGESSPNSGVVEAPFDNIFFLK
jgi:hypothetical protein